MNLKLPYEENLPVEKLSKVFASTSASYKFFWFKALFERAVGGETTIVYRDLVHDMITEAWYMVTEYHLSLGVSDQLQSLIRLLQERSGLKPSEKKEKIREYLESCKDPDVLHQKEKLMEMVPYRLQSAFLPEKGRSEYFKGSPHAQIARLNAYQDKYRNLMYRYCDCGKLDSTVTVEPEWIPYLQKNQEIIRGWLAYSLIQYLQARNPNVPGISDKITPPETRNLTHVKQYWKMLLAVHPVREIYTGQVMDGSSFSIDHFVPWSYVAHDELWNLNPTTRSINSSKSNDLPKWEQYFPLLQRQEYELYREIWKHERILEAFNKCADKNLNDSRLRQKLYQEGLSETAFCGQLDEVLRPVYQSAKNCGFREWSAG